MCWRQTQVRPHRMRQRAERRSQIQPQTIGSPTDLGVSGAWKSPRTENRGMTFATLSFLMSKKTKLYEFVYITVDISYSITIYPPR